MKIVWISSIAWKNGSEYMAPVHGAGAVSGSLFQQAMIEGLEQLGHHVDIVADYPYAAGCNIHQEVAWSHNGESNDIAVKTIDAPYLSLLYKERSLKNVLKQKFLENEYDVAIGYLIHQPYLAALAYAKRVSPNTKTVLICPDLPDMMDMSLAHKRIKLVLKKIDLLRIKCLYNKIDGFVLFADAMREKINAKKAKYITIEGVASVDDLDVTAVEKENFIMYAGTLHHNMGIQNIINALDYIPDNSLKLKIYGTGELEEYIENVARSNPRVIFGGFIARKDLFEEQKRAVALISARDPKDEYTRYSFPSKTFEYLWSGTPYITTRLDGVRDEYRAFLHEIEDNCSITIANAVKKISSISVEVHERRGNNARLFISREKNAKTQAQKLIDFVFLLIEEKLDDSRENGE